MLPVLEFEIIVRHTGDVIAYHPVHRLPARSREIARGQPARVLYEVPEKLLDVPYTTPALSADVLVGVEIAMQKLLEASIVPGHSPAETGQTMRVRPYLLHGPDIELAQALQRGFDQVGDQKIQQAFQRLIEP